MPTARCPRGTRTGRRSCCARRGCRCAAGGWRCVVPGGPDPRPTVSPRRDGVNGVSPDPRPAADAREAALAHRGGPLVVLGAPGTGKSTLAVDLVVDRVRRDGVPPETCLVLAPTRRAAASLRAAVTARLGGTTTEPLARTPAALAFALLRQDAVLAGRPEPRLLSGAEQD